MQVSRGHSLRSTEGKGSKIVGHSGNPGGYLFINEHVCFQSLLCGPCCRPWPTVTKVVSALYVIPGHWVFAVRRADDVGAAEPEVPEGGLSGGRAEGQLGAFCLEVLRAHRER